MSQEYAIIILGFKRLYSLQRLLKSFVMAAKAFERKSPLTLIISLDYGSDESVKTFVSNFFSKYFKIIIVNQETHLGPDKHNLWAMQQSEIYEAVLVLEDDTWVSPSLFYYADKSLNFYSGDEKIAGISLYNYERNEACNYPFLKLNDGSDTYFYQKASSRGFLLTTRHWQQFKEFKKDLFEGDLPSIYENWGDEVWEKQFNKFLIQEQKYWVYPTHSLSTNFGEIGMHVKREIYRYAFQSNVLESIKKKFEFRSYAASNACYDAFGEAVKTYGFKENEITNDIFGVRNISKIKTRYILTTRHCTQSIEAYALDLRPPELNLTHHLMGFDLMVTEPKFISENYFQKQKRLLKLHYYFYPDKGILHLLRLKISEIFNRFSF